MRVELQIQERISKIMNIDKLRVHHLESSLLCKEFLKKWFDLYNKIHKETISVFPKKMKGNRDADKFFRRDYVQMIGWENLVYKLKKAVKQKSLSASDKSKKLNQFREVMLDNSNFEFQENTKELNHKIKVAYVEGLKQIFKMESRIC